MMDVSVGSFTAANTPLSWRMLIVEEAIMHVWMLGTWKISVLPTQFFSEPKTAFYSPWGHKAALKKQKVLIKKKTKRGF